MNERSIKIFPIKNTLVQEAYVFSNIEFGGHFKLADGITLSSYSAMSSLPFGGNYTIENLSKLSSESASSLVVLAIDDTRTITSLNPNDWLPIETQPDQNRCLKRVIHAASLNTDLNPFVIWRGIDLPGVTSDGVHMGSRTAYSIPANYFFFGETGPVMSNLCKKPLVERGFSETYQQIRKLPDRQFDVFDIAMSRLTAAKNKRTAVDRAFDAGLAAEVIFLHGEGGAGAKGELRYKISNRAAWFLGETKLERKHIAQVVRKGYDARSSAVHTGSVDVDGRKATSELIQLCKRATAKIIQNGGFPIDWNDVVF